jgi:diguanylate cyclase (GGDEF)-like protein
MNDPSANVEENGTSVQDAALRAQARILHSNGDNANLIVGCVLVAALLDVGADRQVLAIWFGLLIAVNLARLVIARRYHAENHQNIPRAWVRLLSLVALAGGVVWGLPGALLFFDPGPVPTVLIVFVLAGVAAAGVAAAAVAVSVRVYLWFLIPVLVPMAAYFLFGDGFVDRMIGVLVVFFGLVLVKNVRSIEMSVTENAALNVKNATLVKELQRLATSDPLTGTCNRSKFNELLQSEFYRSRRYAHALTVGLFDIDRFKTINDAHGHGAGDACLKAFSDYVQGQIRRSDVWARLGGEEFALMLPDTGGEEAVALCERIRSGVAALEIPHNDQLLRLTVSIGVVACTPADESIRGLMSRADEALYQSKNDGRNGVTFLDSPSAELQVIAAE